MRDCPSCGAFVDGEVCPKCRYSESKRSGKVDDDPDRNRCAHVDPHYGRCKLAGTIAYNLQGGGPWYCRSHDKAASGIMQRTAPPGGWQSLRNVLRTREPGEEG